MTDLDNARRAYEVAKRITSPTLWPSEDAKLLLTLATATYETALLADAQAKLDAMSVVVGETMVIADGWTIPFVVKGLRGDVSDGSAKAYVLNDVLLDIHAIRPYGTPVAKEMVLYGCLKKNMLWLNWGVEGDTHRLTLTNVTPADLDGMKPGDVIEGSYKIEGMK